MPPRIPVKENERSTPLGETGKFQIIKIYNKEFIETNEFTDNVHEGTKRLNYLNNRAWAVVYMLRKKDACKLSKKL